MKRLLRLLPAVFSVIGRTGTPPAPEAPTEVGAADPTTVCEREQSTGSRMISVRCGNAADREQDRRAVEAMNEATHRVRSTDGPGL